MHRVRLHAGDAGAQPDADAARGRGGLHVPGRPLGVPGQHAVRRLQQQDLGAAPGLAAEARGQGEGHLDARRAGAHHRHAEARAAAGGGHEGLDPRDEVADRAGGHRVRAHPRDVKARDGGAHVQRHGVVADGRAAVEQQATAGRIDPGGPRHDAARAGAQRQRPHVDLEVFAAVLSGHEAGDHAGVDRDRLVHDQGEARAGDRPGRQRHRPAPEHLDVGVAAAHQDEIVPDASGAGVTRASGVRSRPRRPARCAPG